MSRTAQPAEAEPEHEPVPVPDPEPPLRRVRAFLARHSRGLRLAAVPAVVLLAFLTVPRLLHTGRTLPGVAVEGVDVGGLTREQTRERLAVPVTRGYAEPVVLTHAGDEYRFTASPASREATVQEAVEAAFVPGRGGNPLADGWAHLASVWHRRYEVTLARQALTGEARAWVERTAGDVDELPFAGEVSADAASLRVSAARPRPGLRVKREQATAAVVAAVVKPGTERLELPVEPVPPPVGDQEVQRVADRARQVLTAPVTLTARGESFLVTPPQLAGLLTSRVAPGPDGAPSLQLDVAARGLQAVLAPHLPRLNRPPRSAVMQVPPPQELFDEKGDATWTPRPAAVRILPSSPGTRFEAAPAAAALAIGLREGRPSVELPLTLLPAEVSTQQLQGLGITHLIGTFTTYHACCRPRVTNIHRIADMVRGTILRPGETFSVNGRVGPRTADKGFVPDDTIVLDELVEEVGGGVSQFATTTFNAAFFAGLRIDEHTPHSYYISRYPMGREATLYYPHVDLKFTNDTAKGIYIDTAYTETSLTVSIYGDNGGRTVSAKAGQPFNFRDPPPETHNIENPTLPAGSSELKQEAERGFDVVVERVISEGGRDRRERFETSYDPTARQVEVP